MKNIFLVGTIFLMFSTCKKSPTLPTTPPIHMDTLTFHDSLVTIDGQSSSNNSFLNVSLKPLISITFSAPVDSATVNSGITIIHSNSAVPFLVTYKNKNQSLNITPTVALAGLTPYNVIIAGLLSNQKVGLSPTFSINFITQIDSTDKFTRISDSALLTLVEQQTFKYFWDFGHPVSGLARERSSSGDIVTTGGSGFGIMSMVVGVQRNFISRAEGLSRIDTIVNFLSSKVTRYHGAFPHWLNGSTGATIPFSTQDDGGDIVETSYMMQGLLCARQFFNSTTDANEISLRGMINNLYNAVEWNWYRQNNQNVLYWHWSPDYNWSTNATVSGWNEALITYVMAASSGTDSNKIPKIVYDNGWARNGGIKNGRSFYGITLPLGPDFGGPLFFAHYSFLGINPHDLTDAYANYWQQDTAHAKINYNYCVANPNHFSGYSSMCWGLTASDIQNGYTASSPTNDVSVIAPTAAISSLPYTPTESMNALRFFYYKLGDKIWGQYGFADAFSLSNIWFDTDRLAIDQGPEIVMIENYRSGLLWNLFMSCPEVKAGMTSLGFQSPNL